eukprot:UN03501
MLIVHVVWLKLALESGSKYTFVSSISGVPDITDLNRPITTDDFKQNRIGDGYGQTKAVSEVLLQQCVTKYGLDLTIIRPGTISSHQETGYYNVNDYYNIFFQSCIILEKIPKLLVTQWCDWTPCNVVAQHITQLDTKAARYNKFNW